MPGGANRLLVDRRAVPPLMHEEKVVSAEMATRISGAVGGTPERWLSMQQAVDPWEAGIKFKSNPVLPPLFFPARMAARDASRPTSFNAMWGFYCWLAAQSPSSFSLASSDLRR